MRSSRGWLGGALVAGLIALGSSSAVASGTISVGPGGTVAAIVTLLEDPPVAFFTLTITFPYDDSTLEPILIDEGDPSKGFQVRPLHPAVSIVAAGPADSSTVLMGLGSLNGIDGAAGDLVEVPLSVVAGSVEVPVLILFTVVPDSITDKFGRPLPAMNWPELDVVLTPEPSGGALAMTALMALAVLRGVRSRLRRVR